jgi:Zn-dependent protease
MRAMLRLRDPEWLSESISWSLAIASLMAVFNGFSDIERLIHLGSIPSYLIAIVIGFTFHELAHRYIASARGCQARFTLSSLGLLITSIFGLLSSLLYFLGTRMPFVIAAPGYVGIRCSYWGVRTIFGGTTSEGLIAMAGPATNIVISIAGLVGAKAFQAIPIPTLFQLFIAIKYVNSVLAVFNLIPIPPLDGFKIARWNPLVYLSMLIIALIIMSL